jgi:hypothetical protein
MKGTDIWAQDNGGVDYDYPSVGLQAGCYPEYYAALQL